MIGFACERAEDHEVRISSPVRNYGMRILGQLSVSFDDAELIVQHREGRYQRIAEWPGGDGFGRHELKVTRCFGYRPTG